MAKSAILAILWYFGAFFTPFGHLGMHRVLSQNFYSAQIDTVKPLTAATFAAKAKWPLFRGGRYSEV